MTMCPEIGPLCLISTIQNHVMSRGRENQPRWGKNPPLETHSNVKQIESSF